MCRLHTLSHHPRACDQPLSCPESSPATLQRYLQQVPRSFKPLRGAHAQLTCLGRVNVPFGFCPHSFLSITHTYFVPLGPNSHEKLSSCHHRGVVNIYKKVDSILPVAQERFAYF